MITRQQVRNFINNHCITIIQWTLLINMLIRPAKEWTFLITLAIFGVLAHLVLLINIVGFYREGLVVIESSVTYKSIIMMIISHVGTMAILIHLGCFYLAFITLLIFLTFIIHRVIIHQSPVWGRRKR